MTAPAEATADMFTTEELQRIDQHIRVVDQEIENLCIGQRVQAAVVDVLEAGEHAQRRRLAAAGGSDEDGTNVPDDPW